MPSNPSLEVMTLRTRAIWGAVLGLIVALSMLLLRQTEAIERPELRAGNPLYQPPRRGTLHAGAGRGYQTRK